MYDVETSLYYITSRYYDPEIGRLISPDSVDYLDPTTINGLNLYAYCGNDPINYYDPSGHIATEVILGGTALYYLLAGLVILIVGTGAVISSQTDFQNISFGVPFEWKVSWNNLSDNVYNMWSDICNWWNGLFNYTSNLASAETEVNNSYSFINYYLLQSTQDPYARPNQKKQGREL